MTIYKRYKSNNNNNINNNYINQKAKKYSNDTSN